MNSDTDARIIEAYFEFQSLIGADLITNFRPFKKIKMKPEERPIKICTDLGALPLNLNDLKEELLNFEGCKLKRFAKNCVFGEGVSSPRFLIIGEAPGEEEDINGIPFCGRSGRLLETMLNRFGIFRDKNAYITNSVFWRPPGNRKPEKDELAACRPFLEKMISILKPEVIFAIGGIAAQNAILKDDSISDLRGKEFAWHFLHEKTENIKLFALYHPSYLLRNPIKKRDAFLDMIKLQKASII